MTENKTKVLKLIILLIILTIAFYSVSYVIGQIQKWEKDIKEKNIDDIKYKLKELNKESLSYKEQGISLDKNSEGILSKKDTIGEKIGSLEISREINVKSMKNFELGRDKQYEIWNLTNTLYNLEGIDKDKYRKTLKLIEINIVWYNTIIEAKKYEINATDQFLIMYKLMKERPEKNDLLDIINIGISAYTGNPDTITKTIDLINSYQTQSKLEEDIKYRALKGSEYLKMALDYHLGTDEDHPERILKIAFELTPGLKDCEKRNCEKRDVEFYNGMVSAAYSTIGGCNLFLEEECKSFEQEREYIKDCLEKETCTSQDAFNKIKERNNKLKSLYPPREIVIE